MSADKVVDWSTDAYDDLRVESRDDGVVLVTLALPDRRNMMTPEMTGSWARLMSALRTDRSVRCVVVTGEGAAFSSGADVAWLGAEPDASVDEQRDRMMAFYRAWLTVRALEVPTVAAINGPAIGAGLAMALACDLRYAAVDARLGVPFTALGLHPGMATTFTLPEAVGLGVARDLLLTGRLVQGEEAAAMGLVNQCFPTDQLLDEVLGIAGSIAAKAPIATRLTKLALAGGGHATFDAALEWEALAQPLTMTTEDLQEGLAAQREKRAARFTGR
jgi:enoyl-CoA hydratase